MRRAHAIPTRQQLSEDMKVMSFKNVFTALGAVSGALFLGLAYIPVALGDQQKSGQTCTAAIQGRFIEGAPKDRFVFSNHSGGNWSINKITLDLTESIGDLIFDTADGGTGVEVFQPFQADEQTVALTNVQLPGDGGQTMVLEFADFIPGSNFNFTIDLDDQLLDSALGQIRITSDEIQSAIVTTIFKNENDESLEIIASFSDSSTLSSHC